MKPVPPLQAAIIRHLKPPSPLLAPQQRPLKPTTPLHPKNALNSPISQPQRRWRFQLTHPTGPQRRQGFQRRQRIGAQRRTRFHTTSVGQVISAQGVPATLHLGPHARRNSPSTAPTAASPRRNSPSRPKNAKIGVFSARWANFFAHRTRQRGDDVTTGTTAAAGVGQRETAITIARPSTATVETDNTFATEKRTKNNHFSPAKAMAVSVEAKPA